MKVMKVFFGPDRSIIERQKDKDKISAPKLLNDSTFYVVFESSKK